MGDGTFREYLLRKLERWLHQADVARKALATANEEVQRIQAKLDMHTLKQDSEVEK